jgi:acyl carrier protein
MSIEQVKQAILAKIYDLARDLGNTAGGIEFSDSIPESGILDSAGLIELIIWYETSYGLSINQEEITAENFGTIDAMAAYFQRSRGSSEA